MTQFFDAKAAPADAGTRTLMTLVGASSKITGDFVLTGSIEIDCEVHGKLEVKGRIIIQKNGFVKADVKTDNVEIIGRFEGNLEATENVEIKETGSVFGSVKTDSLIINKGGIFSGNVDRISDMPGAAKKEPAAAPAKPVDILADHEPKGAKKLGL